MRNERTGLTQLLKGLSTALLALMIAACSQSMSADGVDTIIIDHVTVLDGRGGDALVDRRVTVKGGVIVDVAPSTGDFDPNETMIDGTGKFLLPGYIDMHAHLLFPRCPVGDEAFRFDRQLSERALSRQLDFGITTVRSPANPTVEGLKLRDDLNAGRVRGPHALASAEFINDAGLTNAELRQVVRDSLPYHPDYFKVYSRLQPHQVAVVIEEAHLNKIPVIGHLQRTSWAEGLDLGIDHLVHSLDWSADSLPEADRPSYATALKERGGFRARIDWLEAFTPDGAYQQQLIAVLAKKQVSVDVTLIAYDGKFSTPDEPRYRENPYLRSFPELVEDWRRCDGATAAWTESDYRRWKKAWPKALDWVKRMSDGGVLLVSGTDMTNEWIIPGEGLHQEFELLSRAGLSGNQILRMTGANAAAALRRTDIGVIETGRRADMVLLSADPRLDIKNTRSIIWVMQGGRFVAKNIR